MIFATSILLVVLYNSSNEYQIVPAQIALHIQSFNKPLTKSFLT